MIETFEKEIDKLYRIFTLSLLIIAIFALFLIKWEISIKVDGTVHSTNGPHNYSPKCSGQLDYLVCDNIKVNKGDLLYSINVKQEEKKYNNTLFLLETLKDKLNQNVDYYSFLKTGLVLDDNYYYSLYKLNESSFENKIYDLENKLHIKESIGMIDYSKMEIQDDRNILNNVKNEYSRYILNEKVSTEERIDLIKLQIFNLENSALELKFLIDNSKIYSDISGYVNYQDNINVEDYVQSGSNIIQVYPSLSDNFYVELKIPDKQILYIKNDQIVKYRFMIIPNQYSGDAFGSITNSMTDRVEDNFYLVTSSISVSSFNNKYGEVYKLRNGLICKADIVIEKKQLFLILLSKLNLI